jgi:hypothetical protein
MGVSKKRLTKIVEECWLSYKVDLKKFFWETGQVLSEVLLFCSLEEVVSK